jgi:hypothetical protein
MRSRLKIGSLIKVARPTGESVNAVSACGRDPMYKAYWTFW